MRRMLAIAFAAILFATSGANAQAVTMKTASKKAPLCHAPSLATEKPRTGRIVSGSPATETPRKRTVLETRWVTVTTMFVRFGLQGGLAEVVEPACDAVRRILPRNSYARAAVTQSGVRVTLMPGTSEARAQAFAKKLAPALASVPGIMDAEFSEYAFRRTKLRIYRRIKPAE